MTRAEFKAQVLRLARLQVNELEDMIDELIDSTLYSVCRQRLPEELLKMDVALALTESSATVPLPSDFMAMQNAVYSLGTNDSAWTVWPWTPTITRSKSQGYPRTWRKAQGGLTLFPYSEIKADHVFKIDYFSDPRVLFQDDSDPFPVDDLETLVQEAIVERIAIFHRE